MTSISKTAMTRLTKESDRRQGNRDEALAKQKASWQKQETAKSLLGATVEAIRGYGSGTTARERIRYDERTASHEGPATKRAMQKAKFERDLEPFSVSRPKKR